MEITFLGHSSFLLKLNDSTILFDPFISANEKAKEIDITKLNPDFILLSHGHADHVLDAEAIAKSSGSTIISNFEIATWYQKKDLNVIGMNHGGSTKVSFGKVKYVNAIHSSELPDGTYGGNPGGFIIEAEGKTFYYAGDTAVFSDMALFAKLHKIDFAFLPIGDHFTMGKEEAALAAELLNCTDIIGMHFDTFPPIAINHNEHLAYFESKNIKLTLPEINKTFSR